MNNQDLFSEYSLSYNNRSFEVKYLKPSYVVYEMILPYFSFRGSKSHKSLLKVHIRNLRSLAFIQMQNSEKKIKKAVTAINLWRIQICIQNPNRVTRLIGIFQEK